MNILLIIIAAHNNVEGKEPTLVVHKTNLNLILKKVVVKEWLI
jgi:hypothetical protein